MSIIYLNVYTKNCITWKINLSKYNKESCYHDWFFYYIWFFLYNHILYKIGSDILTSRDVLKG